MATQIGNIGGIDVASRRASFAVLPALDAHGTVVPATHAKHKTFIEVIRGYSKPRWDESESLWRRNEFDRGYKAGYEGSAYSPNENRIREEAL